MNIKTIEATNIFLANIYLVMLIQIAANWKAADCSTGSNLFQLAFILIMICRLAIQEAAFNHILSKKNYKILSFFTSSILLFALGIYQIFNIATHSDAFFYDPKAKVGDEICYQNRIVFVGEIVIIFLTIVKDIYFHIFAQTRIT